MTKRGKVVLLILSGGAILALLFGSLLIYSLFSTPKVTEDAILELKIQGEMVEAAPPDTTFRIISGSSNTVKSSLDMIERAKNDSHIKGILLYVNNLSIRHAKVEEIRDAIIDFRKSGKPVYAYMEQGDDLDYYLASSADKIYVTPIGELEIKGFKADRMFINGLLNKLKVEPNFARYGKYKSAIELFTRENMSEAEREEINAMLDDTYNRYIQVVAQSRKKSPEEVKTIIDNGPYGSAEKAKAAGLIDGALYLDQVKEEFKQQTKLAKYVGVTSSKYSDSSSEFGFGDKIAVIYASGEITSGKSKDGAFSGRTAGSDTIAAAIKKAREDSDIKAIILRIDSPGGSGLASDVIWREIMLAKKQKPFIASMSDLAASGGYYIAMSADKIVAQPGTITGSIGVFGGKFNMSGLYKDHLGVNVETVTRGRNANIYSGFQNFDNEQMKMIQEHMDEFYKNFITKVAEGRKKKPEEIDAIAQGRVWTGAQAKELGLVDELGGLPKAVEIAKQLAKLPANSTPQLVEYPKSPSLLQSLFGDKDQDQVDAKENAERAAIEKTLSEEMPYEMLEAMRMVTALKRMENDRVLALMPSIITIR